MNIDDLIHKIIKYTSNVFFFSKLMIGRYFIKVKNESFLFIDKFNTLRHTFSKVLFTVFDKSKKIEVFFIYLNNT